MPDRDPEVRTYAGAAPIAVWIRMGSGPLSAFIGVTLRLKVVIKSSAGKHAYVRMYVCMYICMDEGVCVYIYIYIHACIACVYVCMYACMYVCVYVCM